MRDKLIELLEKAESAVYWDSSDQSFVNKIADHLIAHGVTFQQWIPTSERLPEEGEKAVCIMFFGEFRILEWSYIDWMWNDGSEWWKEKDITHWMPMPEPLKEE